MAYSIMPLVLWRIVPFHPIPETSFLAFVTEYFPTSHGVCRLE